MSNCILKRVLPFMLTLILGAGLWSVFGSRSSSRGWGRRGHYRYSHRMDRRNGSTPLRILSQPQKLYTPEALDDRTAGVVKLLVRFNPDGTTTVVEQLSSTLPDSLTDEAVRVAWQTRFIPASVNGVLVAETKEMNYIFSKGSSEVTIVNR